MKEENNTLMTEEDINDLLSPRCDFHASPGVIERVMEEIQATAIVMPTHRAVWKYAGVAAAVAAIIAVSVFVVTHQNGYHSKDQIIATTLHSMEEYKETPPIKGNLVKGNLEEKVAIPQNTYENKDNSSLENKIINEKNVIFAENSDHTETPSEMRETDSYEISDDIQVVIEGPMSSRTDLEARNSSKLLLSNDDFDDYTRMVRQSYIDRVRLEIAETEAFVKEMRESVIESI